MARNVSKFLYWTPRIMAIIIIVFMALMSLDVFSPGLSAGQIAIGLFMHNIPMLILLVVLLISWKYEIVGGIAFILAGLTYIIVLFMNQFEWYKVAWAVQLSGPAFFVGIMFLLGWFKKRKITKIDSSV